MPRRRHPKGVYVRGTPDWFVDQAMSTWVQLSQLPNNLTYGGLYNNATDGSYLYVYGMEVDLTTSSTGVVELVVGDQGAAHLPAYPLRSDQAPGPGVGITFNSPVCLGSHLFSLPGNVNNIPNFWPYAFPLAVIAPGYTVAWQSNAIGAAGYVSYFYVPLQSH